MTVVIALNREPMTRPLDAPFAGCTITLRRLTSNEYSQARDAAIALLKNTGELFKLLEEHDLRPPGRKIGDLVKDLQFMAGVGEWLAAVECGQRAITGWTGFMDSEGPDAVPVPVSRQALEVLFLNQAFLDQVMPLIDRAAFLLVSEGNGSGASPNGSPAHGRTASVPTIAPTAPAAPSPAPKASPAAGRARSARKPSTRR